MQEADPDLQNTMLLIPEINNVNAGRVSSDNIVSFLYSIFLIHEKKIVRKLRKSTEVTVTLSSQALKQATKMSGFRPDRYFVSSI